MLKREYNSEQEIPEGVKDFYEKKGDKYVLKAIDGLKPIEDFEELNKTVKSLKAEKADLETKYKSLSDLDPKDILEKLDKYDELVAKKGEKDELDEDRINKVAEIRTQKLKRELNELTAKLTKSEETLTSLKKSQTISKLKDELKSVYFDKSSMENRVYDGVIADIEIRAERDLEYNEDEGIFVTKDDKRLSTAEWYNKQIQDGAMWEKGSRGTKEKSTKFNGKSSDDKEGTVEDAIREAWKGTS